MKKLVPITTLLKLFGVSMAVLAMSFGANAQQASCNAHYSHYNNNGGVNFYSASNHTGTVYSWNFGDGDTSTAKNPVHAYAAAGTYYVCLTVTRSDSAGTLLCTSTVCDSVHYTPPPPPVCNAHYSHHGFWNSAAIDFDAPYNPPGSTYLWVYGDGTTSTTRDTLHTYAQAGTYYACLTVTKTDTAGNVLCTDTWCDSIHAGTPPPPPAPSCNAHFSHHGGFNGNVYFYDIHNGPGATYLWTFGDGDSATTAVTTHTYAPGTYYACLTVTRTDTAGIVLCSDNFCDSIHIAPPPPPCNAHFSAHVEGHLGLNYDFDPAPNPHNVTYLWTFGDGDSSTTRDPDHLYDTTGTYTVCLTITNTDTAGNVVCTATWCDTINVHASSGNGFGCGHHHDFWREISHADGSIRGEASAEIYPNPVTTSSVLHIQNAVGNVTLSVFENTGRLVNVKQNLTNGDFELNKNELGAGLYFYQVTDEGGNVIKGKLIVE